ncbi:MAG: hypothetical protein Q3979_02820, partial [Actinomycetaceae bacterium]|nr:hypothetical protein [Actinomycetaceae bacterium]
ASTQANARGGVAEESELAKTKTLPTVRIPIAERWTMDEDEGQANLVETGYESSIFSGSIGAERRAKEFSGPGEAAMREREEAARKREAEYASDVDDEWQDEHDGER